MVRAALAIALSLPAATAAVAADYTGSIGSGNPVHLRLDESGRGKLAGCYLYDKVGKAILLAGTVSAEGEVVLEESLGDGKVTGRVRGRLAGGVLTDATWSSADGKRTLPVTLIPYPVRVETEPLSRTIDEGERDHEASYVRVKGLPKAAQDRIDGAIEAAALAGCDAGESSFRSSVVYADRGVLSLRARTSWSCTGAAYPSAGPTSLAFLLDTGEPWDVLGDVEDIDALRAACAKAIDLANPHVEDPDRCTSRGYAESVTIAPDGLVLEGFFPHVCGAYDDYFVWIPWSEVGRLATPGSRLALLAGR